MRAPRAFFRWFRVYVRLRRVKVRRPFMLIREARRADLQLEDALAMLQNETGIPQRNIFGCDHGPQGGKPPYCQDRVTRRRVKKLLEHGRANGIGWTQLTYMPFVWEAESLGGAHRPQIQCRVGFRVLADNMMQGGSRREGFRAYNGSGSDAEAYASRAIRRARQWGAVMKGERRELPE